MNREKLIKKMSKKLPKERYYHTLGVAYTADSMAMKYGADHDKAFTAGMLHDCAKAFKSDKYILMAEKANIEVSDSERENVQLLHSKLGAYIAKEKYGISDEDILNSITFHTTGRPDMSLLEKIIYIADYIEPGRTKQKRLPEIRKMAFENIDVCLFMILEDTMEHLKSKNNVIDPMTEKTYIYYKDTLGDK